MRMAQKTLIQCADDIRIGSSNSEEECGKDDKKNDGHQMEDNNNEDLMTIDQDDE